jgi:primase-polymerase (primpol)-like protein
VVIDLDHSVDRITGAITDPQAAEIVQSLNSYIEMYGQERFTTIAHSILQEHHQP